MDVRFLFLLLVVSTSYSDADNSTVNSTPRNFQEVPCNCTGSKKEATCLQKCDQARHNNTDEAVQKGQKKKRDAGPDIGLWIFVAAVIVSGVMAVTAKVCSIINHRKIKKEQTETISLKMFEYKSLPDRLEIKRVLGNGAFGVVKHGLLHEDNGHFTDVVVKMLRDDANQTELRNFGLDIELIKSLGKHPNIVSLLEYRADGSCPFLIVEYCARGDLLSFLRGAFIGATMTVNRCNGQRESGQDITFQPNAEDSSEIHDIIVTVADMINFGRQIAAGMEYLASKGIVHRNLAAKNVLVCDNRVLKISNFGLRRQINLEIISDDKTTIGLPHYRWMAIESIMDQVYTAQSDVWSFGIVLWEIVTLGCIPYPGVADSEILEKLQSGYRMERPADCSQYLYDLMVSCWQKWSEDRPTFTVLSQELEKLISETADDGTIRMCLPLETVITHI